MAVSAVPVITAVNCCFPETIMVAREGEILTAMTAEAGPSGRPILDPPQPSASKNAQSTKIESTRMYLECFPSLCSRRVIACTASNKHELLLRDTVFTAAYHHLC